MATDENIDNLSPAKRALYEIRNLRARVAELERADREPIAIVGIGLRFPGHADDVESFWEILAQGRDTVTEIPDSRWNIDQYYDPDPDAPGKMYTRHGAFLDDPALFDADFFGISPREAARLDPQHRIALEVVWEALENAGCSPERLSGTSSGIFLALSNSDYGRALFRNAAEIDAYSSTGNNFAVAAGRISYLLGLQGPSLVIDTACSGSLVAVHLASRSLRSRECDLAIAGGVNLILTPEININFSKSRMMAADGKCKSFDAAADGYVRGEGCGMVVLKRLSDAVKDRDNILALARGSAVNQDGRSGGLTVPNGTAQESVISQALANAEVEPHEIDYIEAHGTGTSLGDPIEAHALVNALGKGRAPDNPLFLGSVKTNIGHTESAAGIAGLIKVALALKNEQIPKHLHFNKLNPHIDLGGVPVQVPTSAKSWPRSDRPRFAGVSSFGFSGTNAHVILQEAPVVEKKASPDRPLHILTLSARADTPLSQLCQNFAYLLADTSADLADICYTANAGRAHFNSRLACVAASKAEMRELLLADKVVRGMSEVPAEVVFLFPGQGAQYAGMGKELYDSQPVFRRSIDGCAELLKGELEHPLRDVLWGNATHLLEQTAYTQPALFAVEYSLAELWKSWGVQPSVVLGHSVGEYVAACIAGVYSLADGLKLISARARLMQAASGEGAMSAVMASEARTRPALAGLEDRVSIAALNAPQSVVISGYAKELALVEERLRGEGMTVQRLRVSHAFHSPQMREIEERFESVASNITLNPPALRLISSVTGKEVAADEVTSPGYWRRQVIAPVRFHDAITALSEPQYCVFLEVGPGTTLAGLGRQCIPRDAVLWAPSLIKSQSEWSQILNTVAHLYTRGVKFDWDAFDRPYDRRRVPLPTYPFQRKRFWLEENKLALSSSTTVNGNQAWKWICESGVRQSMHGRLDLNVAQYPQRWARLDKLTTEFIVAAFESLGAFQQVGQSHSTESLVSAHAIKPSHEKLLRRWFMKLSAEGWVQQEGDRFRATRAMHAGELQASIAHGRQIFSPDSIFLDYVIACGQMLVDILTGRQSPLETLFPSGEFTRAEDIYERAPLSAYFGSIARAVVEGFLRSYRGTDLRIVEIGAGTGSTTSSILPILPPDITRYYFTDVSDIFLNHGRRKFADYAFLRFGHLDIEHCGPEYPEGSFDLVIATNVLHATQDIRATISKAKALLAPGGLLVVNEATDYLPWYDITTGLIEGWQRFEDGLRTDHPLLPAHTWEVLLAESGFDRVLSLPEKDSPATILGQRVFAARNPLGGTRSQAPVEITDEQSASARPEDVHDPKVSALFQASPAEQQEILVELIRNQLADMLRFDSPEQVERKRRLIDLGLDSLMALELRNRLRKVLRLGRELSATLVFDYPTVDALAEHLRRDVLALAQSTEEPVASADGLSARAEELQSLDDEQAQAILMAKLKSL